MYRRRHRRYGRRKIRRVKAPNKWAWYAKKAWQAAKFLKGIVNAEKHYFDISTINGDNITNTGTVYPLTQIAQGDDVNQRNGNSLLGKTLYIRAICNRVPASTSVVNSVRLMIVKDLEGTGSAPTVTDILQAATVTSPLNVDHTPRYQVMLDKVYALSINGNGSRSIKLFKRVNDHVKYTGPLSTDIYKNQLYLISLSDQGASYPQLTANSRFAYYDN